MKVGFLPIIPIFGFFMALLPLSGQELGLVLNLQKESIPIICECDVHKEKLDAYIAHKRNPAQSTFLRRSSSSNMDIGIYIDTSYERRSTGGYNNNDSIVNYLNDVINNVQNAFNLAASNWDVIIEPDYVFFDGVTPFSYGANTAETLINFYDWIDSQGYPGTHDTYVFYSGHYTNVGVAFLGSLCLPGGAMVGYVQNQDSNEDLSSHEWVGHCANSPHFNTEINIMNSVAHRPWNQPSIDIIENFLENQSCVENVQGSLSFGIEHFTVVPEKNEVSLQWRFEPIFQFARIEKKFEEQNWESLWEILDIKNNGISQYRDWLNRAGNYYYRLVLGAADKTEYYSEIRHVYYQGASDVIRISGNIVSNRSRVEIRVLDLLGRYVFSFREPEFDLNNLPLNGLYVLQSGREALLVAL